MSDNATLLAPSDTFVHRHIGPRPHEVAKMLATIGVDSLDALIDRTVPATIRIARPLKFGPEVITGREAGEYEVQAAFRAMMGGNKLLRSLIGMGYYACITPPVIQRNILENPGWYTQYTPYQAEIAQGRLEALLNFQTVVSELTGLPLANASLLDEATAKYGSRSVALRWVFAPERSMHVQGLAIDVGSGPDAEWLSDHGAAFGLCRTLSWEWWHFEWRPGWEDARRCPTPARSPADAPDVEDGSANKPDRGR